MDIIKLDKIEKCVGKKYVSLVVKYPITFKSAITSAVEVIYSLLQPRTLIDFILSLFISGRATIVEVDKTKDGFIESALIGGVFKVNSKKIRAAVLVITSGNYKEVWVYTKPNDDPRILTNIFDDFVKNKNPLKGKTIDIFGNEENLEDYTWDLIAIPENLRREIEENIIWPVKYIEKIKKLGLVVARGILIEGERGMGKTTLTKIIGREIKGKGTYIRARPSDISKLGWDYVFEVTKTLEPSVLCIEDIESLTPNIRDPELSKFITDFLDYLDGVKERGDVLFLATTNEPGLIDLRILDRPGRIDRRLILDPRDKKLFGLKWKEEVLRIHLRRFKLDPKVDIRDIAKLIEDIPYTGAHIKELVNTAAIQALRRMGIEKDLSEIILTFEDFKRANEILKSQIKI